MRSRKIARITTASPPSKPRPTWSLVIPRITTAPSPPAPTIPAITTIDRANMITWLTPAMMVGRANGICMRVSICSGDDPNASPASTTSLSTCLIPNSVSLTAGGMANTTVATTPGTFPIPKKVMAGIRYTYAGMFCMKSRTGRMIVLTSSLLVAAIPNGMLISAATVLISIPLGIAATRSELVSTILRPVLDFMQTMPAFVYLIPAITFFGIGKVPGVVATVVFAMPPAVRLTELGIRQVDKEVVEAGEAFGSSPLQILTRIQIPLALPTIMAGVNQVIMLALSMVVIAGIVGAGGLGAVVIRGITRLQVGLGFEGGLAVVILAIFLDRITAAFSERSVDQAEA